MDKSKSAVVRRVFKIAISVIGAWVVIGTLVFIAYPWHLAHRAYVNSHYNYPIRQIEYRDGHRGVPYLRVDTGWYLLRSNTELELIPYIKVGDSIVKEQGSTKVKVYRRAADGHVIVKEFE